MNEDILRRAGSSPLARGLHRIAVHLKIGRGIIPARAGFTHLKDECRYQAKDHPRSRGVYSFIFTAQISHPGSSPLARGLPEARNTIRIPRGIIPARAGFTAAYPRGDAGE